MSRTTRSRGRIEANLANIPLPAEVLALVAEELEGDLHSLKALSQVSSAWCQRARDLLYRTVYLGEPKAKTRCKALVRVFSDRPSLGHNARKLVLVNTSKASREGWIPSCTDLEKLLALLSSIRSVTIRSGLALSWNKVPLGARACLLELFARPCMKEIEWVNIHDLVITPFAQCHQLERLVLDNVSGNMEEVARLERGEWVPPPCTDDVHVDVPKSRLKVLHFAGSTRWLMALFQCIDLVREATPSSNRVLDVCHLEELQVNTRNMDHAAHAVGKRILERCAGRIWKYGVQHDSIHWSLHGDEHEEELVGKLFSLQDFPSLTCLNLKFSSEDMIDWGYDEQVSDPIQSALVRGLNSLGEKSNAGAGGPALEELTLTIVCHPPSSFSVRDELHDILESDPMLPRLSALLANETAFSNLARVSLVLDLGKHMLPVVERNIVRDKFRGRCWLLGPEGRNILEVKYVYQEAGRLIEVC